LRNFTQAPRASRLGSSQDGKIFAHIFDLHLGAAVATSFFVPFTIQDGLVTKETSPVSIPGKFAVSATVLVLPFTLLQVLLGLPLLTVEPDNEFEGLDIQAVP
jgi:hypothetical protein